MLTAIHPMGLDPHASIPDGLDGVLCRYSGNRQQGNAREVLLEKGQGVFLLVEAPSGCVVEFEGGNYWVERGEMGCLD